MELFEFKTINELCLKITDGAHFSPSEEQNGIYPMYSSKDMLYNGFDDKDVKMISKSDYDRLVKQDCRPLTDDILIIKDGNNYLKQVFKVKSTLDAVILSSIAILRPNKKIIDPDYFTYVLRTESVRKAMANYVSGAAIPRVVLKDFKKMKLKLHKDINAQRHIASILSAYDNLIENNTRRICLLEQMAENLYKEWFVRFRFPDHEHAEFENGLPKGWDEMKLGDWGILLDTGNRPKGGIDETLSDGIPSLGAEAIKDLASFDYSATKYIPCEFYHKMKRGRNTGNDILLYKDGAYIGKVTLFRDSFPFSKYAINEHVFFISPMSEEYKIYLYFTLHQEAYFSLMQNLNRNAAQPGLSKPDIERVKILIPTKVIIDEFNKKVEPILSTIFKLAKQNSLLAKQRDLLLPRLMSGKLEVNV